jgi:hypothetical protein
VQALRAMRSALLIVVFSAISLYLLDGDPFPPHGNPLLYAVALSWLVSIVFAMATSAIFFRASLTLFSLARWEKEGEIYGGTGVRAFRWVLLHSPLGWINPNLHLSASRADCDRLLREMNTSEGVHWLTCAVSVVLAIRYLFGEYAMYGYAMLLVRIPFDLYPILLLRWNRGRVCRVLRRHQLRSAQSIHGIVRGH